MNRLRYNLFSRSEKRRPETANPGFQHQAAARKPTNAARLPPLFMRSSPLRFVIVPSQSIEPMRPMNEGVGMDRGEPTLRVNAIDLHRAITRKERSSRYIRTAIDYFAREKGTEACDAFLAGIGIPRESSVFRHVYDDENWNSYELEVYVYERLQNQFEDPIRAIWNFGVMSGSGQLDQKDALVNFKVKVAPVSVILKKVSETTEKFSLISHCRAESLTPVQVKGRGHKAVAMCFDYDRLPGEFAYPYWTSIVSGFGIFYGLAHLRKGLDIPYYRITHWPILPSDLPHFEGKHYDFDPASKNIFDRASGEIVANARDGPFELGGVIFNNGTVAVGHFEYRPESLWTILARNTWQRPRLRREQADREKRDKIVTELGAEHQLQLARYESELRQKITQIERLKLQQEERSADLEKANNKLLEMDQIKSNFFANISHELRTPLTLLLSPMESMLQGEAGHLDDSQRDLISSMHRNGQKLLKLINNLLDFSKLEAGRMVLSYREVDLIAYVRELASAFDSAARQVGLELRVESNRPRIRASVDVEKMEKIVLNLISNAFKFTLSGGIFIAVNEENEDIEIRVRDTGIGIPVEKLEAVFERFTQIDGSTSRRYEGTGIGLSLARELAQLHQGTLHAVVPDGGGSEFIVRIPRYPPEIRAATGFLPRMVDEENDGSRDMGSASETRRSATRGAILGDLAERHATFSDESGTYEVGAELGERSGETVLLVEDTHDMRRFLYFLLKPHFKILTAQNGRHGLEKAQRYKPDLILSDVMMPEMDGYQLLAALKGEESLRTIPVILLTAKADIAMKIEGINLGADDYVVKPFNSRELLSRIRSQLRIRRMNNDIRVMRDQLAAMNEKLAGQMQVQVSELIKSSRFQSYLPPQLVSMMQSRTPPTVQSERKKLSIFFSDIVDFTRISEALEPEDLARLLNHYLSEMTTIARRYTATVDKFIGDAIVCHFGDVGSVGDKADAVACVQMAVDMQLRMRELSAVWIEDGFNEPLQIRCGINTGFAAVGNFGSEDRLDYTVIGSNMNLASRIQTAAPPGGILVSHSTWALVRTDLRLEPAESITPKGFQREIPVYRVLF